MLAELVIRKALPHDTDKLCVLLNQMGMVTEGVLFPNTHYWLAEGVAGELVGLIGVEHGNTDAVLLRSAAVDPRFQRRGAGGVLVQQVLEHCKSVGIRRVYCFSTDAGDYWQYCGFREVPVAELVAELPEAPQVRHFHRLGWLPTEIAWRKDID